MLKHEVSKPYLSELIILISETSVNYYCKIMSINDDRHKKFLKSYIYSFLNSIPKDYNLKRIGSNFQEEFLEVNLDDLNIELPKGYIVFETCGHNGDYSIVTGLTKEEAYKEYEYLLDNMFTTEAMIINENKVLEYGRNNINEVD